VRACACACANQHSSDSENPSSLYLFEFLLRQEFAASPYLGVQPPTRSSAIQSQNPSGWKHHNFTVLQTCWWTAKIVVPNDGCLESVGLSCDETGAAAIQGGGQRFLDVKVVSESIYDVLDVRYANVSFENAFTPLCTVSS
jgi:hypothetical protein